MGQTTSLDVLIVGAGMAGASLAIALKDTGLIVGLLDRFVPQSDTPPPSFDDRSTALSQNTVHYLRDLGLWSSTLETSSGAIRHIHVSDAGHWGKTRLHAHEHGVDAFGYVVENRLLGSVMAQAMTGLNHLQQWVPSELLAVELSENGVKVTLKHQDQTDIIETRLLVAADGANSTVRDLLRVPYSRHDYQQTAMIANLAMEQSHEGWAFERFASDGPMAVLPLSEQRCALVWTQAPEVAKGLMACDDAEFVAHFLRRFGFRLGDVVKLGERTAYPLSKVVYRPVAVPGVVFIGNAANSLHPVAGQGFNLGVRDVRQLARQLHVQRDGLGSASWVSAFERQREMDQQVTVNASHGLISLFGSSLLPAISARNMGLFALDRCSMVKDLFVHQAMGYAVYE